MAESKSSKAPETDPLAKAAVYRMRRDALMIVSSFNRGCNMSIDVISRQVSFVQAQLCSAAIADPKIPAPIKTALVQFQAETIQQSNQVRRSSRLPGGIALDYEV